MPVSHVKVTISTSQTPPQLLAGEGTAASLLGLLGSSSDRHCQSSAAVSQGNSAELLAGPGLVPGWGSTKKHSCKCLVRDAAQSTEHFHTEWEGPGWSGWAGRLPWREGGHTRHSSAE